MAVDGIMAGAEISLVDMDKPEQTQIIIGHAGFIKTAEDLYEALISSVPKIRFGVAFNEASGPRLVRVEGNDAGLKRLAGRNALAIGAGHSFVIMFEEAYPINVSNAVKSVAEVSTIFCATANHVQVVLAKSNLGSAIIGVVDGSDAAGIEKDDDRKRRRGLLKRIGYKLE
jgi:adenosine/AMP kinase